MSKLLHNEAFILLSQTTNKKKLTFICNLFRIFRNKRNVLNESSKDFYLHYREIIWCKITKKFPKLALEWYHVSYVCRLLGDDRRFLLHEWGDEGEH